MSQSEVSQIRSQYQQAQAAIPAIEQQIAALENLISILLGRNPGPIPRGKTIDQLVAPLIPADLPSALLQRRPDILQAEQNLVAANANIGAARALYYPTISLTGALGSASTAFGNFLIGPGLAWRWRRASPARSSRSARIEGQVRSAEAGEKQALYVYQQTILNAFRETNDALTGSQKKIQESAMQVERVVALREFARLSRLKFDKGIAGLPRRADRRERAVRGRAGVGAHSRRPVHAGRRRVPGDGRRLGGHRDVDRAQAARHGGGAIVAMTRRFRPRCRHA